MKLILSHLVGQTIEARSNVASDTRMPDINGFQLSRELQKIDDKPKLYFITEYELYYEALKKDFPELDVGCFIKKPIAIEDLAMKIREELA